MLPKLQRLSSKIIGMLVIFFLCAITAISLTLLISWQLEGGAAAINDAGSQRMRSYRIGHLLGRGVYGNEQAAIVASEVGAEMERFEKVLRDLEMGDPVRPLSPPRDAEVYQGVRAVKEQWNGNIRPILRDYLRATERAGREEALARYDGEVVRFVAGINNLVLRMESNYAFNATLLRTCQIGLAMLAVIGTAILIRFFFVLVIRPVDHLQNGIRRMSGDDFSVRLPVETQDEFGVLANGFNRLAEHLQEVYATLEERVQTKTRSLAEKNRELEVLYETAAFLNEPDSIEELCKGFVQRMKRAMGARAGAVRLCVGGSDEVFMLSHEGLSEEFVAGELALPCGFCLCGEAIEQGCSFVVDTTEPPPGLVLQTCVKAGFRTATAFTISYKKETLGLFNLYFDQPRKFTEQEVHLLETLGQHLGVAVENQRLHSRERELAVSEERNLLAQELHDSIAQGLAFLNIQAQLLQDSLKKKNIDEALETAVHIREGVQESYDDVRELLVHFRTRVSHSDLDSAILSTLEKFEGQTGIRTEFDRVGTGVPLEPEDEIQVLHIVQEALSNIRKHSGASKVDVKVERSVGGVAIEVRDDGVGFDPATNPAVASDRHVGLKIMKERAFRIGGECLVKSAVGEGTRVTLSLPRLQKETT
ncbi:MAG TPA: type IV pili methyl-accepting chemotaxis transducer N-terminal domain-containing protein [Rhodocyclaceae bacterium]|nr:type IV pili methyl-accepting chemotaxis transducer N-terminal domain-containing protein [Rhodocyclaceae bacterium]